MDGKWSENSFLLGSCSLANHGGYLTRLFYYLPTNNALVGVLVVG